MKELLIGLLILLSPAGVSLEKGSNHSSELDFDVPFSAESDTIKDLSQVCAHWAGYLKEKNLDRIVDLYAPDAVFLTGSGDRFTGKAAIRELFKTALATNSSDLSVRSIRTEISGNLAFDSGEYRETITPVNGAAKIELQGNYLIVFRKEMGGRWLIIEHMWTDKPAKNDK